MSEPAPGLAAPGLDTLIRSIVHRPAGDETALPVEGRLPSFAGATGWLNTEPLTPEELRGRVVLVDFWTYTCVNWLRTLPYVRAWAAKYADAGLTVVSVHTPEFGFEHDIDNVIAQSEALRATFPIALDNDYGVWQAFDNHYWPAVYIADAQGQIRFHHFGEGEYEMTEMVIQRLLLEAGANGIDQNLVMVDPRGLEVAANWQTLRSPETYTGYRQSSGFSQENIAQFDQPFDYVAPEQLPVNVWGLSGNWTVAAHAAVLNEPRGRVAFQFDARDLNLVMGPPDRGAAIPFRVFLDGELTEDAFGVDVGADGRGIATDQRTYQLIRQPESVASRRFEIEFDEPGVEVYCFTFG